MPEVFGDIQRQLNDFWQGLDNGQKVKLISVVILSMLIVVIGIYFLSRPKYEVLFSRLETQEMADATKKLTEINIDYKIAEGGYSLLVPKSKKNQAKLALADANIPKDGANYADAFSNQSMFSTEADKKRQYIEFKSKEVARVLVENSNDISDAEVFFNLSENSNFLGDDKQSTASVKITPNKQLSSSQVEGIARFVANSASGLTPENVEVVDNNMNTLKDFNDSATGGASRQFTLTQEVRKKCEQDIKQLLSNQSAEFDNVKVIANLKLDFDKKDVNSKIIEPVMDGSGAIVSKSQKTEQLENKGTGGAPGTDSNSGTNSYPNEDSSTGSTYKNTDTVTNYEYNEKVVQESKSLGQIDFDKSSIAVVLEYGSLIKEEPGQEVKNKVTGLVSKATGLSEDKVNVSTLKIGKTASAESSSSSFDLLFMLQQYGVIAVSAVLLILLAIGIFTVPKKLSLSSVDSLPSSRRKQEEPVEEIELDDQSQVTKQIDKILDQKPEAVANLLRNWLTEDWE